MVITVVKNNEVPFRAIQTGEIFRLKGSTQKDGDFYGMKIVEATDEYGNRCNAIDLETGAIYQCNRDVMVTLFSDAELVLET